MFSAENGLNCKEGGKYKKSGLDRNGTIIQYKS